MAASLVSYSEKERKDLLLKIYGRMLKRFGQRNWWPGETQFEVCVGAVLTQNTAWKNVEKAIANLKQSGKLDLESILNIDIDELALLIRPAGYFRLKARRLKSLVEYLYKRGGRKLSKIRDVQTQQLRAELLAVWGIGPETADSILLYAFERPVFVVDAYTKRIFSRMGLISREADYEEVRTFFENNLPERLQLFNDYHAQIVATGHNYCSPKPRCEECPLEDLCPKLIWRQE